MIPPLPSLLLSISLLAVLSILPFPLSDATTSPDNYIVRFLDYRSASAHRAYLEDSLDFGTDTWHWIERNNAAVFNFPTDFGVVEILKPHRTAVIAAIQGLDGVKDVHLDATYRRELFAAAAADPDWGFGGGSERRAGKRFTRMSFEEGEEEEGWGVYGNKSSVSWKRKLMMEVSSNAYQSDLSGIVILSRICGNIYIKDESFL